MNNKSLRSCILIVFFLFPFTVFSQSTHIEKPILEYKNEKLFMNFDLPGKKPEVFNISVEIVNSSGEKIEAKSLIGDIGKSIKSGKNKQIVWEIYNDNVILNEAISVKIIADLIPEIIADKHYSKGKLILQSTVWPGWGQTKLKNGKPYWLIGVAGTTCIAGAYVYNRQSVNNYNNYKKADNLIDEDKYYDLSIQQDNTSKILAYSAIGIWTANIIWVALMPNNEKTKKLSQKIHFNVVPIYTDNNNTVVSFNLSLNF